MRDETELVRLVFSRPTLIVFPTQQHWKNNKSSPGSCVRLRCQAGKPDVQPRRTIFNFYSDFSRLPPMKAAINRRTPQASQQQGQRARFRNGSQCHGRSSRMRRYRGSHDRRSAERRIKDQGAARGDGQALPVGKGATGGYRQNAGVHHRAAGIVVRATQNQRPKAMLYQILQTTSFRRCRGGG